MRRFSVEDTCELLGAMGIQNTEPFRDNGVTGGDFLDLSPDDLKLSLNLTTLQVRFNLAGIVLADYDLQAMQQAESCVFCKWNM